MKGDIEISNRRTMTRLTRPLLWAVGALVAFYIAVSWTSWHRQAGDAAGMGARIACSCRYVEGRGLGGWTLALALALTGAGLPDIGLFIFACNP